MVAGHLVHIGSGGWKFNGEKFNGTMQAFIWIGHRLVFHVCLFGDQFTEFYSQSFIIVLVLLVPFRFAGLVTPFSLRSPSHHRENLDESRLDWDILVFLLFHLKKFSTFEPSMNPVDGAFT